MDIRILRSQNKLKENFADLLKTKELKDITVLELCKKANINRTTFYKYYKDVDDFVFRIEESLISDLEKYISDIQRNYLISYTSKIIETINDHRDIYSHLLSENGDHTFLRKILGLVYEESINEWQKLLKKASREDLDKIYKFIVDGTVGIIEKWIKDNFDEEPNNVSVFINKICMSGLSSFI